MRRSYDGPIPTLAEVDRERARRSLQAYVPWLSPTYSAPRHLAPLTDRLERAVRGEMQQVVCAAPPRHAKTETVLHYVPWALGDRPELVFGYATYADRLARSKSRKAMALAQRAGIGLASASMNEWRTREGGGLLAGGVGGPFTGYGVDIFLVDDPIKNRLEAESRTYRERIWDWFNDVATTRIEPGGSCFVFMTRWHPDDLSGRLIKEGWEYICLPAIDEEGRALWPERWPLEALEKKKRVGAYTWASLYQGRPRPRGGTVFGEPHAYSELPTTYRAAFGVDLSYSAKTSSDWSVAVKMLIGGDGRKYVVDVIRKQLRAPKFKRVCRREHKRERTASWRFYGSGTETGSADFFREPPFQVPLRILPASADKFVRAIQYAADWNAGRVLVPRAAPWLETFLSEHASFTGTNDDEDDQVDAAVAASDELDGGGEEVDPKPARVQVRGLAAEEM